MENALEMAPGMIDQEQAPKLDLTQAMYDQMTGQNEASAVESVADQYEAGIANRIMGKAKELGSAAVNSASGRKIVAGATVLSMFAAPATAAATAVPVETSKTTENGTTYTRTSTSTVAVGHSKMSASAMAKVKVYGNLRTVSKAQARKDKAAGKCDTFTAKQVVKKGIQTEGHTTTGRGWGWENRKSTFCDSNGDGRYDYRFECGNRARGKRPQPEKAKQTLWVENINNANVSLRSKVTVKASSMCKVTAPGVEVMASATGSASASASEKMKLRNAVKAHGKGLTKVKVRQVSGLEASLKTEAKADARTECAQMGGTVVTTETPPEQGAKNGSETPANQGGGQGQNPADTPGSPVSECYDNNTGAAVACS